MSGSPIALQQADDETIRYVEALLDRNDLPSEDVRPNPEWFYVGYYDENAVAIGGIEVYDSVGLLRSIVVDESVRRTGIGTATCEALEAEARTADVETLYLLTTTASGFFATLGYEEVDRDVVPEAIQETSEFADLCPDSATCMRKTL